MIDWQGPVTEIVSVFSSNPNSVCLVTLSPTGYLITYILPLFNVTHAMAPLVIITGQPRVSTF